MIDLRRHFKRLLAAPTAVGGLGALILAGLLAADPGGGASALRERAIDSIQAVGPRAAGRSGVLVVDIDSASVTRAGGWPLPRDDMAQLAARILEGRPASLAFDIFFDGPDRHSLRAHLERASDPRLRAALAPFLAEAPDPDHAFGETLERGQTILAALAGGKAPPAAFNFVRAEGQTGPDMARPISGALAPYEPLATEALALGVSSLFGEDGGVVRKTPLLLSVGAQLVPGLALEATRVAEGVAMLSIDASGRLVTGTRSLPLGEGGALRLRWSDSAHRAQRTLSAADILGGRVAPDRFAGRVVIVGASAPQAGALRPTSLGPLTPTVQIHAEAAEQILAGTAPLRPRYALPVEVGAALVLAGCAAAVAARVGPAAAFALQLALSGLWMALAAAALISCDLVLDPVGPPLIVLLSGNMAAAAAFARTRRMKAFISRKFEQYLSVDVVREIIAHPERLRRQGEMRVVTALFTDIENFTPMTRRLAPHDLIALLDNYLGGLERIVTDHGGMVDGVTGDAIHAFFNVPLERVDHADAAIACAAAIVEFSESFRKEPLAAEAGFGRTRVGVETGPAIVGDVGGARRLNYTAYGDAVIVAARLEQANKQFDSQICIGPGAAAATRRKLAPLGALRLKGLSEDTMIFTLAGD
ncbi:adenylate/guanylate cyclase domain-containing protein [Methylosinus sp. H3A]|uniref:CHASE2 domain-containing protein n=1 Tax=Methylosinus sp. H3A TaxID=2785786 RepID=UPI0018C286A1|nr:adenylate/guanylate cyclase domain-containing protein [Methylosinus sp. H3A]MBG0812489.1 adenylate/guanylate cyclase domain-containing protein [Methylosinus sp. H3A]